MKNRALAIVFVYLGKTVPNYVFSNAEKVSQTFDIETFLYLSHSLQAEEDMKAPSKLRIRKLPEDFLEYELELNHDKKFRERYWFLTYERLLALKEIHNDLGRNYSILHVEADVIIMPTFPFSTYLNDKIRWCRHDETRDVASLVYLPSYEATNWLFEELLLQAKMDANVTDMSALRRIRESHANKIEVFNDISTLENLEPVDDIFDGLSLGLWLFGADPKTTYGISLLHEKNTLSSTSAIAFTRAIAGEFLLQKSSQALVLKHENLSVTIHCVHVHSKNIGLFQLDNLALLDKYVQLAKNKSEIIFEIDWRLTLRLLLENFQSNSLMNYVGHLYRFMRKGEKNSRRILLILRFLFRGI